MTFGERFLAEPGWFPAAEPPVSGGDRELLLALPGGPFRLRSLAEPELDALLVRFGAWAGGDDSGDAIDVRVLRCPPARFRPIDTRGWEYTLDFDFGPDRVRLAGLGLLAELAPGRTGDNSLWTAGADPATVAGDCENVLRVLCACRLLAEGAVMIHGAGVAHGKAGVVAVGRSGAGKTTFSRLAAASGGAVLSDDLVAVRAHAGGVRMEQLPFGGDLLPSLGPRPPVALAAILRLEKAPEEELRAMSAAEAVAMLLTCCPVVNVDPHRRARLFDVLRDIVAAVPAGGLSRLRFRRDGDAWRLASTLLSPRQTTGADA